MSIRFTKFVDITSGVGGASQIATRQFCARVFSNNVRTPGDGILSFNDPGDVGLYYGTASEEYKRAVKVFGYLSPSQKQNQQIQYTRWYDVAASATAFGATGAAQSLAFLKTIVAGLITFQFGATSVPVAAISFAAATSLSDVAAELQTALRLNADPHLATATVTYDPVGARFIFTASSTVNTAEAFSITQTGAGITDVATALALMTTQGAVLIQGSPVQQPVDELIGSVGGNGNFGSFCFMGAPTLEQVTAVALQNKTYNVQFQYWVLASPEDYSTYSAALIGIGGTGLVFELDTLTEYPEMIPMEILGATDFTARAGVQGYMFRQDGSTTPSVNDNPGTIQSDALDVLRVNYYGQTEINGQDVSFFQRGTMCGLATDPQDINVYANEQWLKATAGGSIMNLLLAITAVGANSTGRAQLSGLFLNENTGVIPQALNNGTISVGKPLTNIQIAFITQQTGDANAWQQVQNIGYWFDVIIQSIQTTDDRTEWQAAYTLIYSKDDLIRSVIGTHSLI